VEVTITGIDLEEPDKLLFSHSGIKAEPIIPPPPPPPDPKKPPMPPPPKPPITKFKVTIGSDVPLGIYDIRVVNKWGASNPRAFVVGDLTEVLEKEPNNDVEQSQKIELNSTVSGAINAPTDVDYYTFTGKKGQRVVFSVLASSIDSRSHPALEVYDSKGKLLAANRNYHDSDALTDLTLAEDGDYTIRLFEFTHTQGTPEHFYRLSVTTGPWIDAIHPCVVEPGKETQLTVYGRNLPGGKLDPTALVDDRVLEKVTVTVNVPSDPAAARRLTYSGRLAPSAAALDGFEYRIRAGDLTSNSFLLTFATAPLVLDSDTTRTAATAQEITLPCEIAGRIEKRRDRDWYVFTAKKGDVYNIEVLSERLGSPTLMYFLLRNPETKQDIYESPDNTEPQSFKFFAHTEDPLTYRFTVPADGKYQLLVSSRLADTLAGPRHYYRVRITPDRPDFRLAAVPLSNTRPDSANLHQGGDVAFSVLVWRRDNFAGDITLSAEGLPPGVTCPPQVLGNGVRQTTLVLSAAEGAAPAIAEIKIKGTATINGQPVVQEARYGSVVWPLPQPQQPMPTVSRIDRSLVLAVRDKAPYKVTATLDKPAIVHGDKGTITVKVTRIWPEFKTPLTVQPMVIPPMSDLPANLTLAQVVIQPAQNEVAMPVVINPNVQPGTYNIVLRTFTQFPYNRDPKAPQKPPTMVVQPSTPVTLTVLPKTVGTLALAAPNPTVKVGTPTDLVVKVTRQFNFAGEFKVEVVLPANVKDVTAEPVVIPAGKDEAKLVLKVPADAMPGNRAGLIVRATALVNGNVPTIQETPLAVNVVK
jgi:hypothetical protein